MTKVATGLVYFVGLLHVWFLVLESFLWTTPFAQKALRMTAEQAETTKILAMNQGLYNGFLAAGLFWAAYTGDFKLNIFFVGCVVVAGIVGAATASKNIFFIQCLPGILAMMAVLFSAKVQGTL